MTAISATHGTPRTARAGAWTAAVGAVAAMFAAAGCTPEPVAQFAVGTWTHGDAADVTLDLRADGTYTFVDPALPGGSESGTWLIDATTITLTDDAEVRTSVTRTYYVNIAGDLLGFGARLPVTEPEGVVGAWSMQVRTVQELEALGIFESTLETQPDGTAVITVRNDGAVRSVLGTFAEVEPGRIEVTTGPDDVLRVLLVDGRVIIDDDALFVRAAPTP